MFVRMRQNADKFVKEAEKIRQSSPEKKVLSPARRSNNAPASVAAPAPAASVNNASGMPTPPSVERSTPVRNEVPVEKLQERAPESSPTNKVFYGVAAAAMLGMGLFIGYKMYQGETIDAPVDGPAKPQV